MSDYISKKFTRDNERAPVIRFCGPDYEQSVRTVVFRHGRRPHRTLGYCAMAPFGLIFTPGQSPHSIQPEKRITVFAGSNWNHHRELQWAAMAKAVEIAHLLPDCRVEMTTGDYREPRPSFKQLLGAQSIHETETENDPETH